MMRWLILIVRIMSYLFGRFFLFVRQVILINFCLEVLRSLASSYDLLALINSYQKNCVVIVQSLFLVRASSDLN